MSGLSDFFDGMHGVIFPFGGTTAPAGFLMCDGASYSRTAYASLFAVIGTAFGDGDGSTTFNVPDLRGEFLRGLDGGRGVDAGRTLGSDQLDAFQNFTGKFGIRQTAGASAPTGPFQSTSGLSGSDNRETGSVVTFDPSRVARTAEETRPRNVAVNHIIKI